MFFFLSISEMFGQIQNDEYAKAEKYFSNDRYAEAVHHYLNLLKTDSANANLNYKIGICYLHSRSQKSKAALHFELAALSTTSDYSENSYEERKAPILVYKLLGDTYQQLYFFDRAIKNYEKYKTTFKEIDQPVIEEINWKIEMCKIGKQLNGFAALPIDLKKENQTKDPIYGSYSSTISPDQYKMTFTFQRSVIKNNQVNIDDHFYEDSFLSSRYDSISHVEIDPKKKVNRNEATIASSTDGQILLNYRDDKGIANLYTTYLKNNEWSVPEKLDRAINSIGWEEEECISADGKTLYFTSARNGGYGGKDIYKCRKLSDGSWSKAINLGSNINTPFDEEAPFILPDGVTLYFSSNGHKKIDQFDILSSSLTDGDSWTEPSVVGFPIDTTHDDISVKAVASESLNSEIRKKKSNKASAPKEIEIGKSNYMMTFIRPNNKSFTILKGEIKDEKGNNADDVEITINDIETGEISAVYHSENAGKFSFILPPNKNNNITYEKEGYLLTTQNRNIFKDTTYFEIHKPLKLSPIEVNASTTLNNVFFGPDNATLRSFSNFELNQLSDFLKLHQELIVEISGNSNLNGSYKTNFKLSHERANEVVNYLMHNGISKERLIANGISKSQLNEKRDEKNISFQYNQGIELKILEINSEKNNTVTTQ
jgi:outer membrane protein OmpA-like peptidoglycan-associated protein/tetratricopeptide (TPR) repeat protein